MKVTILNGNSNPADAVFENYLAALEAKLASQQHQVTLLTLREMDIRYCIGCFGCWVKKPGECFSADQSCQVCHSVIHSDFTLWAAPLRQGYPDALLKKMMDKFIPLIHPYFDVVQNEAHHRARYERYPVLGLLVAVEKDTDAADLRIVTDSFSRTALNFKSRLAFSMQTDQAAEAVAAAIGTSMASKGIRASMVHPTAGTRISPPSRLTIFNGSPRGRKGNTPILLDQFAQGYTAIPGHTTEVLHLNRLKEAAAFPAAFAQAECVWLGFPLYTDAMPGIVKAFIEQLEPFVGRAGNPAMGFLVQSGFPEAAHSRYVEQYLQKLADRLGSPYLGTLVKGSGEGVRLMPASMNQKLFDIFQQLGKTFGETGQLDPALLARLASPERYAAVLGPVFKLLSKTPLLNFYWDGQLKQNKVYEKRFARPYA
jgi:multimeric flavodoxin WrbA